MNKKVLIIILIIIISLILGIIFYSLNQSRQSAPINSPVVENNFFPLDNIRSVISSLPIINEIVTPINENLPVADPTATTSPDLLINITNDPVADFGFITKDGSTNLFYINKINGHIITLNSGEKIELSSQDIKNVISGSNLSNNNFYNFYLQTIINGQILFSQLRVSATSSSSTPNLISLNPGIKNLIINANSLITLNDENNISSIKINDSSFKNIKTIWENPLNEWVINYINQNNVSLQTKPSFNIEGSIYLLNLTNSNFKPIETKKLGLTGKISPDLDYILYSTINNRGISTFVKNLKADTVYQSTFNTIADKCVWLNNNEIICAVPKQLPSVILPDNWYTGEINFNDDLWLLNAKEATGYYLSNLEQESNNKIDAIKLKVSPDKNKLYFINKIDNSLWSFDLSKVSF